MTNDKAVISVERFSPFGDWLSVKPDEVQASEKIGEFYIPDIVRAKVIPRSGVVVSVGPDAKRASVGERVIFSAYAGTTVEVAGENLLVMRDEHIIAGIGIN